LCCSADHQVSRSFPTRRSSDLAVTTLPEFIRDTKHLVTKGQGKMYYLKGGELADEILPVRNAVKVHELKEFFSEEFFATKKVVRSEEHTSELQSRENLVCRLLL